MPEAFKNVYSKASITKMAKHLNQHTPNFDQQGFVLQACANLEQLEMKARSDQIVEALKAFMPNDYELSARAFMLSLAKAEDGAGLGNTNPRQDTGIEGWLVSPIADYVGRYGGGYFDISMDLFKALTKRFSSEFGIRYFLAQNPEQTLRTLKSWLDDENHHVRRLISEGSRPRLPWGMRLQAFVNDPSPIIDLLEALKDDESEYVRRSVANNLNDIAKDHPDLVSAIATKWLKGASKERQKLVKHACRTLFKQGHSATLAAFGFIPPELSDVVLSFDKPRVKIGENLKISIKAKSSNQQKWMLDYVIHHQKANGSTSPKVFKWKQLSLKDGEYIDLNKSHSFKPVTTRVYHKGHHRLDALINGKCVASQDFELS